MNNPAPTESLYVIQFCGKEYRIGATHKLPDPIMHPPRLPTSTLSLLRLPRRTMSHNVTRSPADTNDPPTPPLSSTAHAPKFRQEDPCTFPTTLSPLTWSAQHLTTHWPCALTHDQRTAVSCSEPLPRGIPSVNTASQLHCTRPGNFPSGRKHGGKKQIWATASPYG